MTEPTWDDVLAATAADMCALLERYTPAIRVAVARYQRVRPAPLPIDGRAYRRRTKNRGNRR